MPPHHASTIHIIMPNYTVHSGAVTELPSFSAATTAKTEDILSFRSCYNGTIFEFLYLARFMYCIVQYGFTEVPCVTVAHDT
jgi:hypothetical protein